MIEDDVKGVSFVVFTEDDNKIFSYGKDHKIKLWDVNK